MPDSAELPFDHELNATGLICPEPVMMLHTIMRKVREGEVIKVLATDPSTQRDIPKFCKFLGHELLQELSTDLEYFYWIKKVA